MVAEAMPASQVGSWSSLPADLVNRVADCLLATNDLDCYSDLRAVCHHWRSSTADPRSESNQHNDRRFHPTQWVMLEETGDDRFYKILDDGTRLFLNTATGRFVRRKLPLHLLDRDYHLVTSTVGGFLVLADRDPPHAVRVLNPFTGSMIRFKAPVPPKKACLTADVVVAAVGDPPMLVLVPTNTNSSQEEDGSISISFFLADPGSEEFIAHTLSSSSSSGASVDSDLLHLVRWRVPFIRGLTVELGPGGEIVRVVRTPLQGVRLFRFERDSTGRAIPMPVTSIGSRALFVSDDRCVCVNADRIPSLRANCIYFYKYDEAFWTSYVYDLTYDKEESIEETFGLLDGFGLEGRIDTCFCPLPLDELLIHYVMHPPYFGPAWDEIMRWFPSLEDVVRTSMERPLVDLTCAVVLIKSIQISSRYLSMSSAHNSYYVCVCGLFSVAFSDDAE